MLISRRRLLAFGAAGATAAAYPFAVEPQWFETTRTSVPLAVDSGQLVRIVQLTDIHASWCVPMFSIRHAFEMAVAAKPDIICLTGDFITHGLDFDRAEYTAALKRLAAACPTFAVLGNHDGGSFAGKMGGFWDHKVLERMLEESGIALLHNRSVEVCGLTLVGVGDLWANEIQPRRAFASVSDAARTVLLCHNPDGKDVLARYPWKLMLAGHTHGGQVRFPHDPAYFVPVHDKRFVAGLGDWNGRHIYVSRGVGNVNSVRLFCRPEVTVLEVTRG